MRAPAFLVVGLRWEWLPRAVVVVGLAVFLLRQGGNRGVHGSAPSASPLPISAVAVRVRMQPPPELPADSRVTFHFSQVPLDIEVPLEKLKRNSDGSLEANLEVPSTARQVEVVVQAPHHKSSRSGVRPVTGGEVSAQLPAIQVERPLPARTALPAAKVLPAPVLPEARIDTVHRDMLGPPR